MAMKLITFLGTLLVWSSLSTAQKACLLKPTMSVSNCLSRNDLQAAQKVLLEVITAENALNGIHHMHVDEEGYHEDFDIERDGDNDDDGEEDGLSAPKWAPSEPVEVLATDAGPSVPDGTACLLDASSGDTMTEHGKVFKCRNSAWVEFKPAALDLPTTARPQAKEVTEKPLSRRKRWGWFRRRRCWWWICWRPRCYWRCSGWWWHRRCRWTCVGGGNTAPTITCPTISNVYAGSGQTRAFHSWSPATASDKEDGTLGTVHTAGPTSGTWINEGHHSVSYKATDKKGVSRTCTTSFYVWVRRCSAGTTNHPINGIASCSHGYIYGSRCSYSCNTGYELVGPSTLECQINYRWNGDAPICREVPCIDPPSVNYGTWEGCGKKTQGSKCTLVCQSGYDVEGEHTVTCLARDRWSQPGICKDVEAPVFTCPPDISTFSNPKEQPIALTWATPDATDNSGETVTVTSSPTSGHIFPIGESQVTFSAEDSSGNRRQCVMTITVIVKRCESLPIPDHGAVTSCTYERSVGSECDIACLDGFDLVGVTRRECLDTKEWSDAPTVCQRRSCGSVPTISDGSIECLNGVLYESVCAVKCRSGYNVSGHNTITCKAIAQWTAAGTCFDAEAPTFILGCPSVNYPAAALGYTTAVTYDLPQVTDNSHGPVTVSATPVSGSVLPLGQNDIHVTATDETGNVANCTMVIDVQRGECRAPKNTELGAGDDNKMEFDCSDNYVYGATCQLSCSDNNPVQGGVTSIKCEKNATDYDWFYGNVKPECEVTTCPVIPAPSNGALACNNIASSQICTLSCQDTYVYPKVSGQDNGVFFCGSNGAWTPMVITSDVCKPKGPYAGGALMNPEMYYYLDKCHDNHTEIKEDFIKVIKDDSILSGLCGPNGVSCEIENVEVTCGPSSRKKREANTKYKFQFKVKISPVNPANMTLVEMVNIADLINHAYFTNTLNGDYDLTTYPGLSTKANSFAGGILDTYSCESPTYPRFSNGMFPTCLGCGQGLIYTNSSSYCFPCPLGTYQPLEEADQCMPCPDNTTTKMTGTTNVTDCIDLCPSGYVSLTGRQPDCELCSLGSYQGGTGKSGCDTCPFGMTTPHKGATSKDDCVYYDMVFTNSSKVWPKFPSTLTSDFTAMAHVCTPSDLTDTLTSFTLTPTPDAASFGCGDLSVYITQRPDMESRNRRKCRHVAFQYDFPVMSLYIDGILKVTRFVDLCSDNELTFSAGNLTELRLSGLQMTTKILTTTEIQEFASSCSKSLETNILSSDKPLNSLTTIRSCDVTDDCANSPCGLHGVCVDQGDDFTCHCDDQWSGDRCQVPPDYCEDNECANGATCTSLPAQGIYICQCAAEFRGTLCSEEIVHGNWGVWDVWSQCTVTCGGGVRNRTRNCDKPAPGPDGRPCQGDQSEVDSNCHSQPCPVNGQFSSWSAWQCSATCGNNSGHRVRLCNDPPPQHGGDNCNGTSEEFKLCQLDPCPVDGGYTSWTEWLPCSTTCGGGFTSRERNCTNPEPEHGGQDCLTLGLGSSTEQKECNTEDCPVCKYLLRYSNQDLDCETNSTNGMQNCTLTCRKQGYMVEQNEFECGILTDYVWSHVTEDNPNGKLPKCKKAETPAKRTLSVSASMDDVQNSTALTQVIESKANSAVNGSSMVKVSVQATQGQSRKKRATATNVQVSVSVDSPTAGADLTTATDAELQNQMDASDAFEDAAQSLMQNLEQVLNVTVDNVQYAADPESLSSSLNIACSQGTEPSDGLCVECGSGTFWHNNSCDLCPQNQYQNHSRQTACIQCPDGYTTEHRGSESLDDCKPGQKVSGEGSDTDLVIPLTVSAVVVVVAILTGAFVWYKCYHQHDKKNAVGSEPLVGLPLAASAPPVSGKPPLRQTLEEHLPSRPTSSTPTRTASAMSACTTTGIGLEAKEPSSISIA